MVRSASPPTIELTLLGILRRTPMHGYDLYKAVCALDGFGLIWKVKQSATYALLDKLEAAGLLASSLIPGDSHPSRREFRLTAEGERTLARWVHSPVDSIRTMRQDFFARLYFAREEGREQALALVSRQRTACLLWKASIEQKLASGDAGGEYTRIVLSHRLLIVEATLAWMDQYVRDHR
ncbi:MAG TPA: PadR family transcriptional regulator [Holophaga sp.]|nr:PadR family transcriptional regulator [Holophaga sp.]